jgi:hypothetical protein
VGASKLGEFMEKREQRAPEFVKVEVVKAGKDRDGDRLDR